MSKPSTILITGANSGIGFAASRKIALKESTKKVYLACRDEEKAKTAKTELEQQTGKDIFKIVIMDVMSFQSVRNAVSSLDAIDTLILNAGGPGGRDHVAQTSDGIANIMALNVVGQALLATELIKSNKLINGGTIVYSSSEAARGVQAFGLPPPKINNGSILEFKSALDGSLFLHNKDVSYGTTYAYAKCLGVLWMSAMARKEPDYRWISVSPGMTSGTNLFTELSCLERTMMAIIYPIANCCGMVHGVDDGAQRYLDVIYLTDEYKNGVFYGPLGKKLIGELGPQYVFFEDLGNEVYQDNAHAAVQNLMT